MPSVLNALLGVLGDRKLTSLKMLLACGEVLSPSLRSSYYEKCSGDLYNIYGPTETNGVTFYEVPPLTKITETALPIGQLYPNVEALVVDEKGEPLPEGHLGELLIRAPTVMRGYWGQPTLNSGKSLFD